MASCNWKMPLQISAKSKPIDRDQSEGFSYHMCCQTLDKFLKDNDLTGSSGSDADVLCKNYDAIDGTSLEGTGLDVSGVKQILIDLDRTFPEHPLFVGSTETKGKLFRVLCGYTMCNPTVGYCQGMGYIAGVVLMYNEDEHDAFWITASLFESDRYLPGLYSADLKRMKECAGVFEKILCEAIPEMQEHLSGLKIHPLIYLTRWFMCLYTTLPCWDTVMVIWSHFLEDGFPVLFRAALACMDLLKDDLLSMDAVEDLIPFIQSPPEDRLAKQKFIESFKKFPLSDQKVEEYCSQVSDLDVANVALPSSRKRGFDETDGDPRRPEVVEADLSFFQRFVNTFTPAKRKRGPVLQAPARTPASMLNATPLLASAKRKKMASAKKKQSRTDEVGMELKDMTGTPRPPSRTTPYDFSPFARSPLSLDFGENTACEGSMNFKEPQNFKRSVRFSAQKSSKTATVSDEDSCLGNNMDFASPRRSARLLSKHLCELNGQDSSL